MKRFLIELVVSLVIMFVIALTAEIQTYYGKKSSDHYFLWLLGGMYCVDLAQRIVKSFKD